jgi:putative nucleotidyltransferase with HDIG domain
LSDPPASFLQSLSRPPGRVWPDVPVHHGARILLLLVVAAAVTAFFPPPDRTEGERYRVDTVAGEDVIARVAFPVPKTPTELERDRAEARAAVPPTFDYAPLAADTMAARLTAFFARLDSARGMGDTTALQESLRSRSIAAQPAQVALLAEDRVFDMVRRTALRAAREILPRGVVDNAHLQSMTTDNVTVREAEDETGRPGAALAGERSVPVANVLSSRAFFERAVGLLPSTASPDVQEVLRLILIQHIEYTYRLNVAATELDRDAAARSVAVSKEDVLTGQPLVRAGDPITQAVVERLDAHEQELRARGLIEDVGVDWRPLAGAGFLNLLLLLVFGLLLYFFRPEIYRNFRWMGTLAVLAIAYFVIARVIAVNGFPTELLPIAFVALTAAVLWDGRMALVMVMVLSVLTAAQDEFQNFHVLATTLVGGSAAALCVRAVRTRAQTWIFVAVVGAAYAGVLIAFWLLGEEQSEGLMVALAAAGGNAILSSILAMGFIPIFELLTGITTDQTLLEWADPNRPLLKRLSMEAPGTYAHSINVANLAESACTAIGANGLLCRVGLYYHDVGKMVEPHYFVENQPERGNPHDRLGADVSAAIVKAHVVEGLELAREAKVPEVVAAFIPEHHGTQMIGFFWEKAVQELGEEGLDPENYRYPGPKPQSRETAIAMMADSVESATRALQDPTPDRIRDLIHSIVATKMRDGQLDESPITLREIAQVEETFVKVLSSVYHQRIDYPETRHLTESPNPGTGELRRTGPRLERSS